MGKRINEAAEKAPPEERSLSDWIYNQVKEKIIFFQYEPGQFLTETMLASVFQVSKMPIKIAISQLESEGWVTTNFRCKTKVKGISEEDIKNIYDLRSLLEHHALDLIFQKQLALAYAVRLSHNLTRVYSNRNDRHSYLLAERSMHSELISICENKRISTIYNNLQDNIIRISCLIYSGQSVENSVSYTNTAINTWNNLIGHLRAKKYTQAKKQLSDHLELGQYYAELGFQKWYQENIRKPRTKFSAKNEPQETAVVINI